MLAPFECLCGNFILPEPASYVFFYAFSNLRNLLYIIAKLASEEVGAVTELTPESLQNLSYILGQQYGRARFVGTDVDVDRKIGLLTKSYGEISQFHQGAGEDSILDTFKLLQDIPNQSLLVIDEVENSLHPQVHISVQERRLYGVLATLSRSKATQPYIQEPKFHLHEQIGPPCRNV